MSTLKLDSFQILLNGFHKTIENYPPIENVRTDLEELKEAANLNNELTARQKDAIRDRCNNYLSNQYGEQRKSNDARSDYQKKLN